jgi:hypothetical protein
MNYDMIKRKRFPFIASTNAGDFLGLLWGQIKTTH